MTAKYNLQCEMNENEKKFSSTFIIYDIHYFFVLAYVVQLFTVAGRTKTDKSRRSENSILESSSTSFDITFITFMFMVS